MKFLHVIPSINPADGGTVEMVRTLLAADRHGSEAATLDAPDAAPVAGFEFWERLHPLGPGRGKTGSSERFLRWVQVNASRFDAIFVHGLWQYVGHGVWRGHGDTPYYVFPHGMLDRAHRRAWPLKHAKKQAYWMLVERHVLASARAVLFTAEGERTRAQGTFYPYRAREAVVGGGIHPPPSGDAAARGRFFSEYPHLRGRRILLFLGRVHPKKGCDLLLKAFVQYRRAGGQAHLLIAGEGEAAYVASLKRLVPEDAARAVTWAGGVYGNAKWAALHMAEAFVLTSHQENFCVAAVEAMSCGRPVLLSDEVAIAADLSREGAGYRAPDTLEGAVSLLEQWEALQPSQRVAMGKRARELFAHRYDANAFLGRLHEIVAGM